MQGRTSGAGGGGEGEQMTHEISPGSDSARRIIEFLRAELQLPAILKSFEVRFAMGECVTVKCEYIAQDRNALEAEQQAAQAIEKGMRA